jgi:hypothetical protein
MSSRQFQTYLRNTKGTKCQFPQISTWRFHASLSAESCMSKIDTSSSLQNNSSLICFRIANKSGNLMMSRLTHKNIEKKRWWTIATLMTQSSDYHDIWHGFDVVTMSISCNRKCLFDESDLDWGEWIVQNAMKISIAWRSFPASQRAWWYQG